MCPLGASPTERVQVNVVLFWQTEIAKCLSEDGRHADAADALRRALAHMASEKGEDAVRRGTAGRTREEATTLLRTRLAPGCVHWRASLAALAAQNRFRRVACVCPSQAAASALADLLVEELLAARRPGQAAQAASSALAARAQLFGERALAVANTQLRVAQVRVALRKLTCARLSRRCVDVSMCRCVDVWMGSVCCTGGRGAPSLM